MLEQRAWQVVFFSIEEPSNVLIDGQETSNWAYDGQLRRLTVNVPTRPCTAATTIMVLDKDTGINPVLSKKENEGTAYDLGGRQMSNSNWSNGKIQIKNGKRIIHPVKP